VILYIQPIFVPDEERFTQNKNSLVSFGEYIKKYPYDIKCMFGGWVYNNKWWEKIYKVIKDNIPSNMLLEPIRFDKNYGKAYVVNNLYEKAKTLDFDFFLSVDSDIIFSTTTNNLFERLYDIGIESPSIIKKPFGFAALQQTGNCRHQLTNVNQYYIKNRFNEQEALLQPSQPSGLGGGCLFINRKFWDKIGGYKVMGVYAGDDAYLTHDASLVGCSYQLASNILIMHPPESDQEYVEWKYKMLHNGSYDGKNRNMLELSNDVKIYDEFWETKLEDK